MPVNLIGVAISTAFYPKLSEEAGKNDEESFRNTLRSALSSIIWISLPVSIVAFFIRGYVVFFIKNGGDAKIASVLGALVVAIFTQSLYHIVARGYYAKQQLRKPLIISIIAFVVQVVCALLFSFFNFGPEGLAHAMSISALFEVVVLLAIENRDMNHQLLNATFWKSMGKILLASIITGIVSYIITKLLPLRATDISFFAVFPKFCVIVGGSAIVYIITCLILGVEEVKPVVDKIAGALFKNVK
jgi:putative peptidoglycan lipid II flippase